MDINFIDANLVDDGGPSMLGSTAVSTGVSVSTSSQSSESMSGNAVFDIETESDRGMPNSVPARSTASAPHIGISACTPAALLPTSGSDAARTDPSAPRLASRDVSCSEGGSARALVRPPGGTSFSGSAAVPAVKSLGCLQKTGTFTPARTPLKAGPVSGTISPPARLSVARKESQRGDTNRSVSPKIQQGGKPRGMSPGRGGADCYPAKNQSKELNALKDQIESIMLQNVQLKKQVEESNRTCTQLKNSLNEERINADAERAKLKVLGEHVAQLEATREANAALFEENRSLRAELNAQKAHLHETQRMLASRRESALGACGLQNMSIVVPEGAVEGAVVQAQVPNGGVVEVTVPAGVLPGQIISVQAEDLGERLWQENARLWHELQHCRVILANYMDKFMSVMPGMEAMVTEWRRSQSVLPRGDREEQHVRFPFEPELPVPVLEEPRNNKTLCNLGGDEVTEEPPARKEVMIPKLGLSQVNSLGTLGSLTSLESASIHGSTCSGGANSGHRRTVEPRVPMIPGVPVNRQEGGIRTGRTPSPTIGVGSARRTSRPSSPLCSGGKSPAPVKPSPQQPQMTRPRSQDKRVGRPIKSRETR